MGGRKKVEGRAGRGCGSELGSLLGWGMGRSEVGVEWKRSGRGGGEVEGGGW
jgi:hypothetical protein